VLLVDEWETTCDACVEELPTLVELQQELQASGFTLLGIAGDATVDLVSQFLDGNSLPYPIAMSNRAVEDALYGGPSGYPTKALVDQAGRVVAKYLGLHDLTAYRNIVAPFLRADSQVRARARITRTARDVRIAWPASQPGYRAEAASSATAPAWSPVGAAAVLTNDEYVVTVPANTPAQFFRLSKP